MTTRTCRRGELVKGPPEHRHADGDQVDESQRKNILVERRGAAAANVDAVESLANPCSYTSRGVRWLAAEDVHLELRRQAFGNPRKEVSGRGVFGGVKLGNNKDPARGGPG